MYNVVNHSFVYFLLCISPKSHCARIFSCVGVLLRYLESEKYTPERLFNDISRLELTQDVADRIYCQLPTQEEMRTYLKYEFTDQKPVEDLTDEDRLLLHLCKIERLGPRLEIILFMNSFEDSLSALCPVSVLFLSYLILYTLLMSRSYFVLPVCTLGQSRI